MKIDISSEESLYVELNGWTYYIDDSTGEQIVKKWIIANNPLELDCNKDWKDTKIAGMLSVRAYNCLAYHEQHYCNHKHFTINNLIKLTKSYELLKFKNFGHKSFYDMCKVLEESYNVKYNVDIKKRIKKRNNK